MAYHRKHRHADEEEEECADDLAVAAQYAIATGPAASTMSYDDVDGDDNEIDLETDGDGDDHASEAVANERIGRQETTDNDQVDESPAIQDSVDGESSVSDAESDVDLTEQLARMEGDDADAPATEKPMTAHEIDVYRADLDQLDEQFQWNMAVDVPSATSKLSLAGTIQHYMVEDRTVVVLSQAGGTLLQEGSLLVIRKQDVPSDDDTAIMPEVVPLGKILEVFGPVSQPLYSIRLAAQPESPSFKDVGKTSIDFPAKHGGNIKDTDSQVEPPDDTASAEQNTVAHKNDADVTAKAAPPPTKQSDPWSKGGAYTKLLKLYPQLQVYFLQDPSGAVTNLLDLATVYRNSGRGCDASNFYDEEILHAKEEEYSDDEQERIAKGQRGKKKGRGGRVRGRGDPSATEQPCYGQPNMHGQRGSYAPPAGFVQAPQGFYQGASPAFGYMYPPSAPYAQHPQTTPFSPPYAQPGEPPQQYQQSVSAYLNIGQYGPRPPPPPPPPPQKPEDEADTVYYDLG